MNEPNQVDRRPAMPMANARMTDRIWPTTATVMVFMVARLYWRYSASNVLKMPAGAGIT